MIRRKVIILGAPGVGKTSLVARWTKGIFSDRYLVTIGVKIEKKTVTIDNHDVSLQVWDLAGDIVLKGPALAYIRGAAACLLVADGTRRDTLSVALGLYQQVTRELGEIPFALAINKSDLAATWAVPEDELGKLHGRGISVFKTSAKLGLGVEQAFQELAGKVLATISREEAAS